MILRGNARQDLFFRRPRLWLWLCHLVPALPAMTATLAATVQLAVPVLAAGGGILFLSEQITSRFVVAAVSILGGTLVVVNRTKHG